MWSSPQIPRGVESSDGISTILGMTALKVWRSLSFARAVAMTNAAESAICFLRRSIFGVPLLPPNHWFAYIMSLVMLALDSSYSAFIVRPRPKPSRLLCPLQSDALRVQGS